MGAFVVRRMLVIPPVFIAITLILFVLVRMTPGDPLLMLLDPELTAGRGTEAAYIEARRTALGLDRPVTVQYLVFLGELLRGNLGVSINAQRPVADMIAERIGPTVILMGSGMLVALVLGFSIGIVSAMRKNSMVDYAGTGVSLAAVSIPNFFLGLGAIYVFSLVLGWFPVAGMGPRGASGVHLHYLALPALILGFNIAGPLARYVRSGLLEELGRDYVQIARAKGMSFRRVVVRHAMKNSLIPLITVLSLWLPALLAGTVLIEQIFAWPGMGTLALSSIRHRDYPVILGFTVVVSVAVLLANLIADVLYAIVDPRIRYR